MEKLNPGKKQKSDKVVAGKQDKGMSFFIQMLAINSDTNMTRIYSAIGKPTKKEGCS